MERLKTSDISIKNDKIFHSKFATKTLALANADIGCLKSLHTFFKNVCTTCWCNLKSKQTNKQTKTEKTKQNKKQHKKRMYMEF